MSDFAWLQISWKKATAVPKLENRYWSLTICQRVEKLVFENLVNIRSNHFSNIQICDLSYEVDNANLCMEFRNFSIANR